jgi:LCP family protein required for cell wall assembly
VADSRDWKAGGDEPPAERPALPPHMDPRRPRGGLPPRPPRTVPPRPAAGRPRQRPPAGARRVLPVTPRAPRRRFARVMSWIAVATSVAILASAGAGWALMSFYDGKLDRIGLDLDGRPDDLPRDAKNILIVGSDSRGDLAPGEGPQGTGDTFVTGQRADTVILAHLYGDSDQAQLVSFPRDSWVTIPAHVDPDSGEQVEADDDKLAKALQEGGPQLLIDTVEQLSGLHIDHYMQIDFDGFQSVVNKLDGVEVCLPKAAREKDSGIDLPAGKSVIKGDQALAFVRQRKGLPRGDIDRIARQQQFIGAIVRKVLSAGTLLNPLKLHGVVTVASDSLKVDDGLDFDALMDLGLRFKNFNAGGVAFTTVPVTDSSGFREGQSVVLLDEAKASELFDKIRRDVPPNVPDEPDPDAEPTQPLIVAPENIRVRVFNGAGINGLGRQASQALEGVGFQIVGAAADRGSDATETVVLHGPDKADSARTLAAALVPRATTRLDPSLGRTLDVVVGTDFERAQQVTVTGAPKPAPTAASSAAPVLTAAQDPCAA